MKKILILLLMFIPFSVNAKSMIAYEINTHQILYEENINDQRSVASISKIMTAIVACESNKLNDIVTVGNEIESAYGSSVYLKVGEQLTLRDLLYGLMLRSGNDASYAIAKYVGGSVDNFVEIMNGKAKEIGMKNSIFNNPNGLDEKGGNISTAYDMAILTSYAMQNNEYRNITSTKNYTLKTNLNTYSWDNKNRLLFSYKYTTGGKTGYTDIAKRTLVTTASNNNLDIVIVTLNDGNDFDDHKYLYENIFNNYKGYNILKSGNIDILNEKYYKGHYYINNNFKYALKDSEKDNVRLKFILNKNEKENNKEIGYVNIYLGDELLGKENVYLKLNKKVSFWQKILSFFVKDK